MKFTDKDFKLIKDEINHLKKGFALYKTLTLTENDLVNDDYSRVFEVFCYANSHAYFDVEFDATNFRGDLSIKVNGTKKSVYTPVIGHNRFGFDCELVGGRNEIELKNRYYFDATNVVMRVTGFLEEKDYGSRLCVLVMDDGYIVTLHNGAKTEHTVVRYGSGEEYEIIATRDRFAACSKLSGSAYVFTFGDGINMCAELVSSTGGYLGKRTLFFADSDAFCAIESAGGAAFYSVEKGKIKKYLFDGDLNLTVTDTGLSGKEVIDCGEGFIGIVSFDGSVRLVGSDE